MTTRFLKVRMGRAVGASPSTVRKNALEASHLAVRMFHVGHGEAILIVFPGRRTWLIDAGCTNAKNKNEILGNRILDYLDENDLFLEAIIPSHPHADHTLAMQSVLELESDRVAEPMTVYRSDDPAWDLKEKPKWIAKFRKAVKPFVQEEIFKDSLWEIETPVGADAQCLMFSNGKTTKQYRSLFVYLRFHNARFLFTGDATKKYERDIIFGFDQFDLSADVLKVTHHGSEHGTDPSVLNAVNPGIAIVSTGPDSGHRLEQVTLDELNDNNAMVFETLVDGDITLQTDGLPFEKGVLFKVITETPGEFASELETTIDPTGGRP